LHVEVSEIQVLVVSLAQQLIPISGTQHVDGTNQLSIYVGGDVLEGPRDGNIRAASGQY
jgi:hypothetical protein